MSHTNVIATRFAPSPTGRLHKGHAYSALMAHEFAAQHLGRFLLRIEDIDRQRCHPDNIAPIFTDLEWLGLNWEQPTRIQSEHLGDFAQAAQQLESDGFLYPCFCTRNDVLRELERAGRAPHGNEGPVYPGTCRRLSHDERLEKKAAHLPYSLRLDAEAVRDQLQGQTLAWQDLRHGPQTVKLDLISDEILVRKDIGTSYHLAVVYDDALQGISHVIRGEDLRDSTPLHRVLQALLGLPTPHYLHHPLLTDDQGRRLAKRDRAITLESLRQSGLSHTALLDELLPLVRAVIDL